MRGKVKKSGTRVFLGEWVQWRASCLVRLSTASITSFLSEILHTYIAQRRKTEDWGERRARGSWVLRSTLHWEGIAYEAQTRQGLDTKEVAPWANHLLHKCGAFGCPEPCKNQVQECLLSSCGRQRQRRNPWASMAQLVRQRRGCLSAEQGDACRAVCLHTQTWVHVHVINTQKIVF